MRAGTSTAFIPTLGIGDLIFSDASVLLPKCERGIAEIAEPGTHLRLDGDLGGAGLRGGVPARLLQMALQPPNEFLERVSAQANLFLALGGCADRASLGQPARNTRLRTRR